MKRYTRYMLSFMLCIALIPAVSWADDVAIIKSADILPYQEAVKGFKSVVRERTSEYVLKSNDDVAIIDTVRNKKTGLVFTLGTEALKVAKDDLRHIPIVFAFVLNPDAVIGKSQSNITGPNITGIDMNIPPAEQFLTFLKVMPSLKRVGVIYDPSKTQGLINEAEASAKNAGIALVAEKISSAGEAINAISQMEGKIDALWMIPDTTAITPESLEYMLLFSFQSRIPIIGISDKYVKNGALFALSFDAEDMGRQAGEIVMRILNGSEIKTISLLKPRRMKLSINLKTAEKLGIKIPERVLRSADVVFR